MNVYYLKKLRKEAKKAFRVRYTNGEYQVQRERLILRERSFYNIWEIECKFCLKCDALRSLRKKRRDFMLRRIKNIRIERCEKEINKGLDRL